MKIGDAEKHRVTLTICKSDSFMVMCFKKDKIISEAQILLKVPFSLYSDLV